MSDTTSASPAPASDARLSWGVVRLAIVVVGGLVVLQSSRGLEPPKLLYFAIAVAAFIGSCWAVWGIRHRPIVDLARPWLVVSMVFFALISLSLPVAMANGTPLSSWVRDAATYGLFAAAPIFALDAAATRRRDFLLGFAVVVTAIGALSFLVNWITIRNLAVLPISQFVLPTSSLPTTLFLIALAAAILDRRRRAWWIVLAGVGLGVFFVTGARSAILFLVGIPVIALLAGPSRLAGSTMAAIGTLALAVTFAITLQAGFRLASSTPTNQPPPLPAATSPASVLVTPSSSGQESAAPPTSALTAATRSPTSEPAVPASPNATYRPPPNPDVTIVDRISSFLAAPLSDASFQERAAQYRAAWDLFVSSPIIGTGLGHAVVWARWDGSEYRDFTADTPLLLPAKLGLVGVAAIVLLAVVWYRFVRRLQRFAGATISGLALAGWAAILVVLAWTGFAIEDKGFSFSLMLLLALAFVEIETARSSGRLDQLPRPDEPLA